MAQQSIVRQGLIIDASRPPSDTSHSVGLLWTSDQPDAEKYTWEYTTLTQTDIHAPGGIRNHNIRQQADGEPRGHRDRSNLFTK